MGLGPRKTTLANRKRKKAKAIEYRNCTVCQKPFAVRSKNHLVCSVACRATTIAGYTSGHEGMATSTIGAMAELRAAAHLMALGYETYRALSPASSSDLMATKDGKAFRFEVRSCGRTISGRLTYPPSNIRSENLVLFIHRENEIVLVPEIPVPFTEIKNEQIPD